MGHIFCWFLSIVQYNTLLCVYKYTKTLSSAVVMGFLFSNVLCVQIGIVKC